jgi:hypothetical protein
MLLKKITLEEVIIEVISKDCPYIPELIDE